MALLPKKKCAPPIGALAECGSCGLYKKCQNPKQEPQGEGESKILVVISAPNLRDDERGVMVGSRRRNYLAQAVSRAGLSLNLDCWVTGSLICGKTGLPEPREVDYCRPNLMKAIEELDPDIIVPLGGAAIRSVIGPVWRTNITQYAPWVSGGWRIPVQKYGRWVCPSYGLDDLLFMEEGNSAFCVAELWFRDHWERIAELRGTRPPESPDFRKLVDIIESPQEAAVKIRSMIGKRPVAIDYETTTKKPEHPGAEIVTCALYNGDRAIAYPWIGDAVAATGELLKSDTPKIGANNKFEDRWTLREFGHPIKNWVWDGMVHAHCLDNRPGLTSVKFQTFVRYGVTYDEDIHEYLKAPDGKYVNRIREAPLRDVLLYNGLDVIFEYKIAVDQRQEMRGLAC